MMKLNDRIETLIIKSLLFNEDYSRRVLPFIEPEYFRDESESYLIKKIKNFVLEYNNLPTKEALLIQAKDDNISQKLFESVSKYIGDLVDDKKTLNLEWLLNETEMYCQEKSMHNAIIDSVKILNGDNKKLDKGSIPELLKKALAVCFDPNIGHDYLNDSEQRYEFYHAQEERVAFDLENMNKITGGGTPKKTLNIILAGTGVGKTLAMCHFAAANLSAGYNVLYITLEMSEKRIAERIDANLLDVALKDLRDLPKDVYRKKVDQLRDKVKGRLKIKEYPTSLANVNHFRVLLNDLKLKSNFVPDIVYIDYLNLMTSSRIRDMGNSYYYVKSIAEELRGLSVEQDFQIWSATQLNRSGFVSSDVGLEDTSESFGLPATADFMFALISSEDLSKMGQIMVKQLKNRYSDINVYKRFVVGIDYSKMRLYDVEDSAQDNIVDSGEKDDKPVFDKSDFGKAMKAERKDKFNMIKMD